jgi:DNA polymerase-4
MNGRQMNQLDFLTKPLAEEQLTLFGHQTESHEKREQVGVAIDEIREKFGAGAIGYGSILHNDIGIANISSDTSIDEKKQK